MSRATAYTKTTITAQDVRAVVKVQTNLKDIPMDATMHHLGLTNAQLQQVQSRLIKMFNRTVSNIYFSVTIYTLTDRINGKETN
jgi:hypothetical protein